MAGVRDAEVHINAARELLGAARREFQIAQQERGGAAVIGLRNACGKGWLAALEASYAFFARQGIPEDQLPDTERGRRYFARRYMDRDMRRAYESLRTTFHIDGYYEGIVEFEDMPDCLDELGEFIDRAELGQDGDTSQEQDRPRVRQG
jgi:hypothetical protein